MNFGRAGGGALGSRLGALARGFTGVTGPAEADDADEKVFKQCVSDGRTEKHFKIHCSIRSDEYLKRP